MANASTSLMVRLDPDSKTLVARAAELCHVSVSDFRPLPGHNYRLFLSWSQLQAMAAGC